MKITQEERAQFRKLISNIGTVTDPYFRTKSLNGKISMIENSLLEDLEKSYMTLGRIGFWEKLKKLMDEVTEKV